VLGKVGFYLDDKDFTWNENKYKGNKGKHGIFFEEAVTVFDRENDTIIRIISARKANKKGGVV